MIFFIAIKAMAHLSEMVIFHIAILGFQRAAGFVSTIDGGVSPRIDTNGTVMTTGK